MGLNTSYDCWNGSYGGFHAFRKAVAQAAGIPVDDDGWDTPEEYQGDNYLWGQYGREGDPLPKDMIWVLLAHSDCDGRIPSRACDGLADRLEQLTVPTEQAENLKSFIAGLRDAASYGDDVLFG